MKVLGWIIALPLMALALFAAARFAAARFVMCRPDGEVVRVATPMVEKIADYIVEHGVPESLGDIPGLPYELEGCKRSVTYRKKVDIYYKDTKKKEDASFAIINENCRFFNKDNIFQVNFRFEDDYEIENNDRGKISIRLKKTSVGKSIKTLNGKLACDKLGSGFDNRFGFCRQFKQ